MNKDYYNILGVDKKATENDIRKAFLKLSKKYHPDMQSGKTDAEKKEAEERFKEINEANEILSDKNKRRQYDTFGTSGQNGMGGFGHGGVDPREFFRRYTSHFGDFDPFGNDFGFCDDRFGGCGKNDPKAPKDGRNINIAAKFNLEDILYGTTKDFSINIDDICQQCNGTGAENGNLEECPVCHGTGMETRAHGMMVMQTTCATCRGTGYLIKKKCHHCENGRIKATRKIRIDIPQGIDVGSSLRVANEGERGVNGGKNGDIYITIGLSEHTLFKVNGQNLIMDVSISPIKASIGGDIDITTPWGVVNVKIPPGSKNEKLFRINGYGIRSHRGSGDFFVRIRIEPFINLTKEQSDLLKKIENTITNKNIPSGSEFAKTCSDFINRNSAHIEKAKA